MPVSRIITSAPASAAVRSRWARIVRACPAPRAEATTYIRFPSAVRRDPSASTSDRIRQAPVATGRSGPSWVTT